MKFKLVSTFIRVFFIAFFVVVYDCKKHIPPAFSIRSKLNFPCAAIGLSAMLGAATLFPIDIKPCLASESLVEVSQDVIQENAEGKVGLPIGLNSVDFEKLRY